MDCIFCKILAGELPSNKAYEDDTVFAFHDIQPQAPTHVLVVPKQHIPSMDAITEANSSLVADIFAAIPKIARALGLKDGYRVICNCGKHAAQTVPHLHFHIVGGQQLPTTVV